MREEASKGQEAGMWVSRQAGKEGRAGGRQTGGQAGRLPYYTLSRQILLSRQK